jgi:hypothetical protein
VAWSGAVESYWPRFAQRVGPPLGLPAQLDPVQRTAQKMARHLVDRAFAGNQDSAETALCPVVSGPGWTPAANLAPEETAPEAATETEEPLVDLVSPAADLEPEAGMDLWALPAGSDQPAVAPAGRGKAVDPVVAAADPVAVADWDRGRATAAVGRRVRALNCPGFRELR